MPKIAPQIKVDNCREMGAEVILHGSVIFFNFMLFDISGCFRMSFDEARDFAMRLSEERSLLYINGFDHPDIIAGQGRIRQEIFYCIFDNFFGYLPTFRIFSNFICQNVFLRIFSENKKICRTLSQGSIGVEILEDVPDVDYVVVPIGGGGMIAGITAAIRHLKPDVKVIGVESERCPSWQTRRLLGRHTKCLWSSYGAKNSIADGLAVAEVGCNAFATCDQYLDKVISISEDWVSL